MDDILIFLLLIMTILYIFYPYFEEGKNGNTKDK